MNIIFSFFSSARDNRPKQKEMPWPEFKAFVLEPRAPLPVPEGDDPKKGLPAISPAIFRPGANRSARYVTALSFIAFDFDNAESVPTGEALLDDYGAPTGRAKHKKVRIADPVSMEEVSTQLTQHGVDHIVHPSWSDTHDWPHFHAIVPLAKPVRPDQWKEIVSWTVDHLGLRPAFRGVDLPVLNDVARIYFLPGGPCGRR